MAYPNNWVDDGKVWVYYNITDISSATTILNQTTGLGSTMNVDGTDVPLANSYQFSATGEHLIKYGFSGSTWGQQLRNKTNFTKVFFPSNVVTIAAYAFMGTSIVECAGEGVERVEGVEAGNGGGAFYNVTTLETIVFPNLVYVGRTGFMNCSSLSSFSALEKITTITRQAFYSMPLLTTTGHFNNLTAIPYGGIYQVGFTGLVFPSVTTIGDYGVANLSELIRCEIGEDFISSGQNLLAFCPKLRYVTIRAITPPSLGIQFLYNSPNALIYVPAESVQAYKEASGWSSFASRIVPIGDEKRLNINHLSLGDFRRRIMIGISTPKPLYPDPYEDDGWIWCYYNVTTTESATQLVYSYVTDFGANFIIDGVTVARAASYTFSTTGEHLVKMHKTGSCRNYWQNVKTLKRIYFPSVVTSFSSNSVLGGCSALTYVHLSDFSSISGQAFSSCSSLKKINLQDTHITTTGSGSYGTFQNCTSLEKITLPTTVTSIGGNNEFKGCTKLVKINLNSLPNLTSIAKEAFSSVPLTGMELSLPKLTYVGIAAFSGSKIKKIINLGKISSVTGASLNGAFQAMTSLTEVIIPTPVGTLQQYCFNGDTGLNKLTIEATTPPTIGSNALTRCPLGYIYVPAESVDDYKSINWSSYAARIHPIDDGWSLPDGYTAVPYVQTDSRAYIDTGIAGGESNNWVRASFQWSTYVQGGAIYGNYIDDSHKACMALLNDSTSLLVGNNTNLGQSCSGTAADTRTTLRVTNSSALVRGTATTITADASLSDNTANIFLGTNGPDHAVNDIGLRIYHFDIFDYANNVYLVRYIPCVRNSDNKAGLYDRQNNVFRPSDTAVDFIAGT